MGGAVLRKVGLERILRDHRETLQDNRTGGRWPDRVLFAGVPLAVAGLSFLFDVRLGDTGALLGGVSILAGFLFALLLVLLQMASDAAQRAEAGELSGPTRERLLSRRVLLKQVSANVAYAAALAVVSTVALAVGQFTLPERRSSILFLSADPHQPTWFTLPIVFLLVHLVLTLLMVVKRTYAVLRSELDKAGVPPERG